MSRCICERSCGENRTDPDCPECRPRLDALRADNKRPRTGALPQETAVKKDPQETTAFPASTITAVLELVRQNGGKVEFTTERVGDVECTIAKVTVNPSPVIVSYDRKYIFPNVEVMPNYNAAQKVQGAGDDVSGD